MDLSARNYFSGEHDFQTFSFFLQIMSMAFQRAYAELLTPLELGLSAFESPQRDLYETYKNIGENFPQKKLTV